MPNRANPKLLEDFCQLLHSGLSVPKACKKLKMSLNWGYKHSKRREIKARVNAIGLEYGAKTIEAKVELEILAEAFIDENVAQMIVHGEGKGKRGRLLACRLAYEKKRMINPPNAQTLLALSMTQGVQRGGMNLPKVYEARRFVTLQQGGEYKSEHVALALPAVEAPKP